MEGMVIFYNQNNKIYKLTIGDSGIYIQYDDVRYTVWVDQKDNWQLMELEHLIKKFIYNHIPDSVGDNS